MCRLEATVIKGMQFLDSGRSLTGNHVRRGDRMESLLCSALATPAPWADASPRDGRRRPLGIKQIDASGAVVDLQPLALDQFENADVLRFSDGDDESVDWLALYLLPDGRYVLTSAGRRYTGWEESVGWAVASESLRGLVRWGMTEEARQRLGFVSRESGGMCQCAATTPIDRLGVCLSCYGSDRGGTSVPDPLGPQERFEMHYKPVPSLDYLARVAVEAFTDTDVVKHLPEHEKLRLVAKLVRDRCLHLDLPYEEEERYRNHHHYGHVVRRSWVTEDILIGGSIIDLPDWAHLRDDYGITGVINVESEHSDAAWGIPELLERPMPDDGTPRKAEDIRAIVEFARAQFAKRGRLYVHCQVGGSRSPAAAYAILRDVRGLTSEAALKVIQKHVPQYGTHPTHVAYMNSIDTVIVQMFARMPTGVYGPPSYVFDRQTAARLGWQVQPHGLPQQPPDGPLGPAAELYSLMHEYKVRREAEALRADANRIEYARSQATAGRRFKLAFIYGPFSTGSRHFDFEKLWTDPRGLTGSEISCFMYAAQMARRGHDVTLFVAQPVAPEAVLGTERIPVRSWSEDALRLERARPAAVLSWNEPDLLRSVPPGALRIVNQQLNDFTYCKPGYDDFVDIYTAPGSSPKHFDFVRNQTPSPHKWTMLPNGCDPDVYAVGKKVPGRVLWASSADRGLHLLLQCWPEIRRRVPNATLRALYNFTQYSELKNYREGDISPWTKQPVCADILEIASRVRYIEAAMEQLKDYGVEHVGSVSRLQMVTEWEQAEVLGYSCDTIRWSEGFSVTTMEACASGTVPVVTDIDALGDIYGGLDSCVKGWDASPAALQRFTDNVVRGLTDPEWAARVREQARALANEHRWDKLALRLEGLLVERVRP